MYDLVIIGAGPAGLTAGYELAKTDKKVIVFEKKPQVGGLAETKVFGEYRYDIGPHRFFTKNKEVYNLFLEMLDEDAVEVNRKLIHFAFKKIAISNGKLFLKNIYLKLFKSRIYNSSLFIRKFAPVSNFIRKSFATFANIVSNSCRADPNTRG